LEVIEALEADNERGVGDEARELLDRGQIITGTGLPSRDARGPSPQGFLASPHSRVASELIPPAGFIQKSLGGINGINGHQWD